MDIQTAAQGPSRTWFWLRLFVLGVALLTLAALALPTLLGRPTYEVRGGQLVARSVLGRVVIPASTPVRAVTLTNVRRVAGTALPGYCTGTFRSAPYRRLGLITDCSRDVLVFSTPSRPTAISPADPNALLAALQNGEAATFTPASRPRLDGSLLFVGLVTLLPLAILFVSPRLTYRVEHGELRVKTLTNTFRFPLDKIAATTTTDGLGLKVMGTGLPGYYTGTYALAAKGKKGAVQAFATTNRPSEAVLLRHENVTYYLTPADPAAFLALLHQHSGEHAAHEVGEGRRGDGA